MTCEAKVLKGKKEGGGRNDRGWKVRERVRVKDGGGRGEIDRGIQEIYIPKS